MKGGANRKIFSVGATVVALVASLAMTEAQAPPVVAGPGGPGGARGGAAGNAQPPSSPVTGDAANGKILYYTYSCYACHGFNGETGRAFVGNWSFNLANEAAFVRFLRYRANVAPPEPSTGMPNYDEKTLSIKQATDIYAYIRTFKSHAPELKDIPALTQIVNSTSRPYKP